MIARSSSSPRLDYLDATRAFALVLGIVFHASLSFSPVFLGWAVMDISTSPRVLSFFTLSHSFRMELFFLLAGYFGRAIVLRDGAGPFLRSRLLRLGLPLGVGWFLLRPLLVSGWVMGAASMRGDYAFWPAVRDGFKGLSTLPNGLFTGTHLWFLYYLLLVTLGTCAIRALGIRSGFWTGTLSRHVDAGVDWVARSPWGLPATSLPIAGALWQMTIWGMDTPDRSLVPHWPVLAVYGGFYAFGWLLNRRPEAIADFGRITFGKVALTCGAVATVLALNGVQMDVGHPQRELAHRGFIAGYALMMPSLVALTLGAFRLLCTRPYPWVKYTADASYWLYLVHLPVVVWLQVAVAEWPLPWLPKLAFVVVATIAAGLVSYDLLVRPTWVGAWLNGRRRERVLFGRSGPQKSGDRLVSAVFEK